MTKPDAQSEAELGHYALGVRAPMRLAGVRDRAQRCPPCPERRKGHRAPLEVKSLRR